MFVPHWGGSYKYKMTVEQTLLHLFMREDFEKYSDEEVKELLHSETFSKYFTIYKVS